MRFTVLVPIALHLLLGSCLRAQGHAHAQAAAPEQLGTVHFATSCNAAVAPRFDRAVTLLHSFQFGESIRAFSEVAATDSTCAMAYWGLALSRWTNPFLAGNRSPAVLQQGRDLYARGAVLASRATDRERSYIDAVGQLYRDFETIDQRTRIIRYEAAMRALAIAQPQDIEATIFHSVALTASAAPTDKTYAKQLEAGRTLERLWAAHPSHPGLAHYIIHSYDLPPLAAQAESAAVRYAMIAPSAPHALHMPSHTFTRVGWWEQSVRTNLRSIESAKNEGSLGEALHASDYAEYAYLQMCRDSSAGALVRTVPELRAKFDVNAIGAGASGVAGVFAMAAIPARYALERRDWAAAAALEPASSAFPWTEAMVHFARALGASHTGDNARARVSIDSLRAIEQRLRAAGEPYWAEQVAIQQLGAGAWLKLADKENEAALGLMREAAAREDATEKSPVTPGPLAPARELLGDMLLELNRAPNALVEYRATLAKEPNRFRALYGAMRAASQAGDRAAAALHASQIRALCINPERPARPELSEVRDD